MSDTLRPYQTDVVDQIERAIAAGERRILLVARRHLLAKPNRELLAHDWIFKGLDDRRSELGNYRLRRALGCP